MDSPIIEFYQHKVKREWKYAFWAVCIIGFLIHTYRFTNYLPNHDALFNQYSSQNMIKSGRWFLSLSCMLSSWFDLPWVLGVLSILYIALTAVIIVDIFRERRAGAVILIGGLLVSFPALTEIFMFQFTADGYMMAMLLGALAVRLSMFEEKRKWMWVLSALCVCCCCGVYQSFVAFSMTLALAYFITELLGGKRSNKACWLWILRELVIYVAALAAYYLIWQLCLAIGHIEAVEYMGINDTGNVNLMQIPRALIEAINDTGSFFLGMDFLKGDIKVWTVVGASAILVGGVVSVMALIKSRIWQRKLQLVFTGLSIVLLPVAAHIWLLSAPNTPSMRRGQQSLCVLCILFVVLAERYLTVRWRSVLAVAMTVLIFYSGVMSNIFYFRMNRCMQRSNASGIELSTRMHALDDGTVTSILVLGQSAGWYKHEVDDLSEFGGMDPLRMVDKDLVISKPHYSYLYLSQVLDFELTYYRMNPDVEIPRWYPEDIDPVPSDWSIRFPVATEEQAEAIRTSQAFADMPIWPAAGSVAVFDDTIVVKLSDVVDEEDATGMTGAE